MKPLFGSLALAIALSALAGCGGPLGVLRITQVTDPMAPVGLAGEPAPTATFAPGSAQNAGSGSARADNAGGVTGVVYAVAPSRLPTGFSIAQVSEWMRPMADAEVEIVDLQGRPLTDGPVKTNSVGRFAWSAVKASGPVILVRASYKVDGVPVILERAVAAPRTPGGVFVELTPAASLVLKAMRVMAIAKDLSLEQLPLSGYEPFSDAVARTLDPPTAARIGPMTDDAAAETLNRQMNAHTELLSASQALFSAAGVPDWGGYTPGYTPPSSEPHHHDDGPPPAPPSGTVLATPPLGGDPWAMARAANGDVWVTQSSQNTVTAFGTNGVARGTYPVGSTPTAIGFDPSGRAWVVCRGDDTIHVLGADGVEDFFVSFPGGSMPTGVAFQPDGTAWVALRDIGSVAEVSTAGAILHTYPAVAGPHGIGVDRDGNVWVAGYYDGWLRKLDPTNGAVLASINVGTRADYIQFDAAGNVWVSVEDEDKVSRVPLDASTHDDFLVGDEPYHFAFDADGSLWVANYAEDTVTHLAADGTLIAIHPVGDQPIGLTIDGAGHVWVATKAAGTVTQLAR